MICPRCGKKVGKWHRSGVHPTCQKKINEINARGPLAVKPANVGHEIRSIFDPSAQRERDAILRRINREAKPR